MNLGTQRLDKSINHLIMNAWWVVPVAIMITWSYGALICWAQGGKIIELGLWWVKCAV